MREQTWGARLRALLVGRPRDLADQSLFHKVSLAAILAWVGLGADGLSSSCYGPEETFKALGHYPALALFVAFACAATIAIICASYRQIIELFPTGGGGYLVASKLLGPTAGVVSGAALLVDYVLTITISIASGADALFSLLPQAYQQWKFAFACAGVGALTLINLRGVRESVLLWTPVFFAFVATHAIAILIAIGIHLLDLGPVAARTSADLGRACGELGLLGTLALMLRAFSVGAGTYTGIEAVSNGLPILREPRVETGKRTMTYMGISLGVTVFGLLLAYVLVGVEPVAGKTLNAVLFERITAVWPGWLSTPFVFLCMISATVLLFIAAQAGFLDGPRVLANMALDRWFPGRFATLSDRFVTQNGILLMGLAALLALVCTGGSVGLLVVLYSINVFLTFTLSQLGMVVHWWKQRRTRKGWKRPLAINGVGLMVTGFILVTLSVVKFHEGGWITLIVTALVVWLAFQIRRHYIGSLASLARLDALVAALETDRPPAAPATPAPGESRTAIVLINGYNGLGLHTFFNIFRMFPRTFGHFVFVHVGAVDAGTFKGSGELERLRHTTDDVARRYVEMSRRYGFRAEARTAIGHDLMTAIRGLVEAALRDYPAAVVFGGQIAFRNETIWTRWLHNHIVFGLQRIFCREGVPFVVVPVRV